MYGRLIIGSVEIELDVPSPSLAARLAQDEAIALELAIAVQEKLQDIVKRESSVLDQELGKMFERAFRRVWADEDANEALGKIKQAAKDLREGGSDAENLPKPAP